MSYDIQKHKASVKNKNIIGTRSALPLDGNAGGLKELIIDPKNVRINRVSEANPEFYTYEIFRNDSKRKVVYKWFIAKI